MKYTCFGIVLALVAGCHPPKPTNTVGRVETEPLNLGPAAGGSDGPVPINQTTLTSGDMIVGPMVSGGSLTGSPEDLSASSGQDGDLEISRLVRSRIQGVDAVSGGGSVPAIDVVTTAGTVVLRGQVRSEEERQAMEAAAARVPGVLSVDSRLTVVR